MADSNLPNRDGLLERVRSIILDPEDTWAVISDEAISPSRIVTRQALPLAAIGPLAMPIGLALLTPGIPFGPVSLAKLAVWSFFSNLAALLVAALMIAILAPRFGGVADRLAALKLAAAAFTPFWVSGILNLVPMLSPLTILGALYGIFLLYHGSTPLVKVPQTRAPAFSAAVVAGTLMTGYAINVAALAILNPWRLGSLAIAAG